MFSSQPPGCLNGCQRLNVAFTSQLGGKSPGFLAEYSGAGLYSLQEGHSENARESPMSGEMLRKSGARQVRRTGRKMTGALLFVVLGWGLAQEIFPGDPAQASAAPRSRAAGRVPPATAALTPRQAAAVLAPHISPHTLPATVELPYNRAVATTLLPPQAASPHGKRGGADEGLLRPGAKPLPATAAPPVQGAPTPPSQSGPALQEPGQVQPSTSVAAVRSDDGLREVGNGEGEAALPLPGTAQDASALTPAGDASALKQKAADLLSMPVIKQISAQQQMLNQYFSGLANEPIGGGTLERYLPLTPGPPKQTGWLPSSFSDWMQWSTMTGDWDGWRPWLVDHGVTFSGRWLEDSAANLTGGMSQTMQYADEEAFSLDFNLQKLFQLGTDLGTIHFTTAIRQGHSLAQSMPALDSPQEIAGSGEWAHLTKLSWEYQWNRYVRTEVGELNSEDQFEASSVYWGANLYCQFESNAICGMPQSIAMNSGYGWYPTAHPGAWAKFFLDGTNEWTIQTGVYSVDETIQNKGNGFKMGLKGAMGSFVPFQVRWHKGGPDDYSGPFQTNVTLGAYWDSSEVEDVYSKLSMFTIVPPANAAKYHAGIPAALRGIITPRKIRNRHGAYFQIDSLLQRDKADPRRSTAGFFSFTWGNRAASPAPYFVTAGITRKGTFASRPEDTVSLGMKALWASSKLRHEIQTMRNICDGGSSALFCAVAKRSNGLYVPTMETALEFNYGYRPAWWALIRPGIQYIWRPGGTRRYKDAFLLDLEAGLTF
ncbi:hypothetical protein E3202_06925 [Oecophyllibacter saccharovorans]|uniref:Uncharacterized protein n=2 Tax=Oecophyllibacter saccharovorans TaxID=2558360 RepID=A0A506ULL5_9PROT|nr:hypothetical protein E3202_06925 [Oecophyllibacter saccharovorans]